MKRETAIELVVHGPADVDNGTLLARRLTEARAACAAEAICRLTCPDAQKRELIGAVTGLVRKQARPE